MRAVTIRFPGMRASVLRIAQLTGVTEEELWTARERAAEARLAAACERLATTQDMPALGPDGAVRS